MFKFLNHWIELTGCTEWNVLQNLITLAKSHSEITTPVYLSNFALTLSFKNNIADFFRIAMFGVWCKFKTNLNESRQIDKLTTPLWKLYEEICASWYLNDGHAI